MRFYLAGPLFSEAERDFCKKIRDIVKGHGIDIIWPGDLIDDESDPSTEEIFDSCLNGLKSCSAVLAILDGTQVDDGTAWEIGYAYHSNRVVYGLRTDFRSAGDTKTSIVNAMIENSCFEIYPDIESFIEDVKNETL